MPGHHDGLSVGNLLIFAALSLDWLVSHGLSVLSCAGMVLGMACSLISTAIRVAEWRDARRRRSAR